MICNDSKYNSTWKVRELNELGSFSRGISRHRPRDDKRLFEDGKYPLIQTGDIKSANLFVDKHSQEYGEFGLSQSKLWDTGTLCITIAANIAETAIISYPMCFPDSVVGFTANITESSELFMYYIFEYVRNVIKNAAIGSIQENINVEYLNTLKFRVPEKKYQDKVCCILASIDKKILCNNHINENLEQQIKTLYDYWFLQFDFPDENKKPYRSSGGRMVWNEKLKREIPANWAVVDFLDVATWESNSQPPKSHFIYEPREGYIRFIQNRDYSSNDYITYIPHNENLNIAKRLDILMDKYGDAGAVRYGIEGAFNVALGKIKPHDDMMNEYLRSFLENKGIYKYLHNSCMASTRASLNETNLSMLHLVVPQKDILCKYQDIVRTIRNNILCINDEIQYLVFLRVWLLPMLMNGQATVED